MTYFEKVFHTVVLSCTLGLFSSMAFAESYSISGTVTDVETVYNTKTVMEPVRNCWTEEVPIYGNGGDKTGDALTGAIIGGIIGNNVTKNVENGGAVGALLGGMIGHNNSKKGNQITGYRSVNKCETGYNERTEEYIAGYRVTYEALGLHGTTTTSRRVSVGDYISVNVNITAY